MEEALKKSQGKLKFSYVEALLLFSCAVIVTIGLCATAALRKKKDATEENGGEPGPGSADRHCESGTGWSAVKRRLMGSVRWSRVISKWGEEECESFRQAEAVPVPVPVPVLAATAAVDLSGEGGGERGGASAVWQRKILMGERCELPRYSGLILYDERGRPLHRNNKSTRQEKAKAVVTTTLRDLL